jgi:hypothetical protein
LIAWAKRRSAATMTLAQRLSSPVESPRGNAERVSSIRRLGEGSVSTVFRIPEYSVGPRMNVVWKLPRNSSANLVVERTV